MTLKQVPTQGQGWELKRLAVSSRRVLKGYVVKFKTTVAYYEGDGRRYASVRHETEERWFAEWLDGTKSTSQMRAFRQTDFETSKQAANYLLSLQHEHEHRP
jgi:hypothetical protein